MIETVETVVDAAKPMVAPEVQEFAVVEGVSDYLNAAIALAREAFPSSALCISLAQDAEDETHQYIAIDVEATGLASEQLLAGQRTWSAGIGRVCSSRYGVYFVLGWR